MAPVVLSSAVANGAGDVVERELVRRERAELGRATGP